MGHNKLTIIDYNGEGTRPMEELLLNGKKIDYIIDYSISKKVKELTTLTLVIDCKEVEVVKGDLEKRVEEIKKQL